MASEHVFTVIGFLEKLGCICCVVEINSPCSFPFQRSSPELDRPSGSGPHRATDQAEARQGCTGHCLELYVIIKRAVVKRNGRVVVLCS